MRNEIAVSSGKKAVEINMDIAKCYDNVRFKILYESAVKYGFPLCLLRASMGSYRWPRVLMWNYGLVAEGLQPQRGIAAGSGFAQAEIVLYLLPLAVELQQSVPACTLRVSEVGAFGRRNAGGV